MEYKTYRVSCSVIITVKIRERVILILQFWEFPALYAVILLAIIFAYYYSRPTTKNIAAKIVCTVFICKVFVSHIFIFWKLDQTSSQNSFSRSRCQCSQFQSANTPSRDHRVHGVHTPCRINRSINLLWTYVLFVHTGTDIVRS